MTPKEFVQLIPNVLLYIVPGFLVLKITEEYLPKKKLSQYESILWSILYSFIVTIEFNFCCWLLARMCKCSSNFDGGNISISDTSKLVIYFLLAIATGFVITKVSASFVGQKITKLFNPNMVPGEDVWFESLRTQKGTWATIYLNNGLIYTGMLSKFTADPDDNNKLILLKQYRLMQRTDSTDNNKKTGEAFSRVIEDKTSDASARVLLRFEDITAIEMVD